MKDKKVCVNLYGSPGSGKSVAATSLFARLKKEHVPTVFVNEYATECVLENNQRALENQLVIWATQQFRIFCGYKSAQITVTDSPLLLGLIYQTDAPVAMQDVILDHYHRYNNFNIFMTLDTGHPYSLAGRVHSLTESMSIENQLRELLYEHDIPFLDYNDANEEEIVQLILESLK
jgi:ABC-type dipeptide/oligopeptide/nickel transport system ATPase component